MTVAGMLMALSITVITRGGASADVEKTVNVRQVRSGSGDVVGPAVHKGGKVVKIGNTGIQICFSRDGDAILGEGIKNTSSGFDWAATGTPVCPSISLGGASSKGLEGFTIVSQDESKSGKGTGVLLTRWNRPDGAEIDWSVSGFADANVVEYRASLKNTGHSPLTQITEFGPLSLRLKGDMSPLKLHWLNRSAYRLHSVEFDGDFSVSGGSWNRPDAAGWLAIENSDQKEVLFIGIQWESYWRIGLKRQGDDLALDCTVERFSADIKPGESLASPTVFVGVTHGDLDDSVRDMQDYLRKHVMPPKPPGFPWVTYDVWGTEASGVEDGIVSEMAFAREIGVEVFYHDAGWYEGSCKNGSGDWFTGVGNWKQDDRAKLPGGLAGLSEKVHKAKMKFGLWFAPQVVDSSLVGKVIPETWVAKTDSANISLNLNNGWAKVTQICMGNPEVVSHLKDAMASAVENYKLDWLKWDNSGLPGQVCNRNDHGHSAGNGALAALAGEYEIYEYLHKRFPKLVLENCGYPSRLDLGLARYAWAHWLSDDTTDALHCRRSQINGCYVLPAASNEAWVINCGETKNEKDPEILDTIIRSRMIGLFGMGTLNGKLSERMSLLPPEAKDALKINIANYKRYRHLLSGDAYHVLPLAQDADQWDGIQFCKRDGSESVLLTFRGASMESEKTIRLRGLKRSAAYTLSSFNNGEVSRAQGSDLADKGVTVRLPKTNTSEIYLLKAE